MNQPQSLKYFALLIITGIVLSGWSVKYEEIADVKNLPQNPLAYIKSSQAHERVIPLSDQRHLRMEFETQFFGPWERYSPGYSKKDALWSFHEFRNQTGWNEVKKLIDPAWIGELETNADLQSFPNKKIRGISVRNTHLRMLPTRKPFFYSFDLDGEGFPFDNLQHSNLPANTPIFVSHATKDGAWSLVESHYGLGWVATEDIAYVTQSFIDNWQTGKTIAILQDNISVISTVGTFLFKSSVGSQFPFVKETESDFVILAAVPDMGKSARIIRAQVPKRSASKTPLPLTPHNLATVAKELVGVPYGWGGMYENRDCSSLTKDFLSVFGVYLPTNSVDQGKHGRGSIDLANLSHFEKRRTILQKGVPFLTLLWMKGHIMLYIGALEGEPIVMHSTWGIRTKDWFNPNGRHLVAKTVITTLEAGRELENHNPDSLLINRLQKMTFLTDQSHL